MVCKARWDAMVKMGGEYFGKAEQLFPSSKNVPQPTLLILILILIAVGQWTVDTHIHLTLRSLELQDGEELYDEVRGVPDGDDCSVTHTCDCCVSQLFHRAVQPVPHTLCASSLHAHACPSPSFLLQHGRGCLPQLLHPPLCSCIRLHHPMLDLLHRHVDARKGPGGSR